jgi:hypothetical protein
MTVKFHPRALLVTAAFFAVFGVGLLEAVDLRRGVAMGIVALIAYACIELFIGFNPAIWRRDGRS